MNILIIGAGGREHTLAWKIRQSKLCNELFIAPGNAGTALVGTNLPISINDFPSLKNAAIEHKVELIVVGPEEPLVNGLVDFFAAQPETKDIHVIGPSQNAAQLEGSKAFAKAFMQRHQIPTAAYREFSAANYQDGVAYIKQHSLPVVLKADGLAAGKGVLICQSQLEALAEFELMILRSKFGEAGNKVVVEEFIEGIEISVFVLTDGKNYLMLPEAKDYKRVGEGDTGLNTGGMGAVSPLPFFNNKLKEKIRKSIIEKTIQGLQEEKLEYSGFIFFGLMINNEEPLVIEYNCRLGDPETEVVIPRIKNDLVSLFSSLREQRLNDETVEIDERTAAAIVAVSGGYPGPYQKGLVILGIDEVKDDNSHVFQAGTVLDNGDVLTNGGRVLVVTSFGENIREATGKSLDIMTQLYFDDIAYRRDIGYEFIDE